MYWKYSSLNLIYQQESKEEIASVAERHHRESSKAPAREEEKPHSLDAMDIEEMTSRLSP